MNKCCDNCKRAKDIPNNFLGYSIKCTKIFPIIIGGKYVSKDGYCPSWKSDKPKGYEKLVNKGNISDGYHTFDELYEHRMVLFSVICNQNNNISWKSWKHDDGTMFDNYFIVGINTPEGQATYHYHKDNWDTFKVQELSYAPKFDGHTPDDVLKRLQSLGTK